MVILFSLFVAGLSIEPYAKTGGTSDDTGGSEQPWERGTGIFNDQNFDTEISGLKTITSPRYNPYVEDLDGDGTNEIIAIDGTDIKLFTGNGLNVLDSITLSGSNIAPLVITDIDGDGTREVISLVMNTRNITIFEWSGSAFSIDNSFILPSESLTWDHVAMNCDTDNECMAVFDGRTGTVSRVGASTFDENGVLNSSTLYQQTDHGHCLPWISELVVADFDNDGDEEYHFTTIDMHTIGDHEATFHSIRINQSGGIPIAEQQYQQVNVISDFGSGIRCDSGSEAWGNHISPPAVFNFDGSPSNGLEFAYVINDEDENWEMFMRKNNGGSLESFSTQSARGVSNIVVTDAIDTDEVDACTATYKDSSDFPQLGDSGRFYTIYCGTFLQQPLFSDHRFYQYNNGSTNSADFSITTDDTKWNNIIHSADMVQEIDGDFNPKEFLTSYGVMSLNNAGCISASQCSMTLNFEVPAEDTTVISADVETLGIEDILMLGSSQLIYLNDGFVNQPCTGVGCIGEVDICPSPSAVWEINTTFQATMTLSDNEGDNVAGRVILYNGDSNEQDTGWSLNLTSGTIFTFATDINGTPLTGNKTITSGTLTLMARDVITPSEVQTVNYSFTVAPTGINFEDDICLGEDLQEGSDGEIGEGDTGAPCNSNSECSSALCEYGYCTLQPGRGACNTGSQCLSGECVNSMCTKADFADQIEQSAEKGLGSGALLFIALFVAVALPIAGSIASRSALVSLIGIPSLLLVFTILEWVPPFLSLMIFVVSLAIIAFLAIIGRGGD